MSMLDKAEEIVGWRQRRVRGLQMTAIHYLVLDHLNQFANQGAPFQDLPPLDPRVIRSLLKNDWVFESPGIDGSIKYGITNRGQRALQIFSQSYRRNDGICPICGERPKMPLSDGSTYGYCIQCDRERKRRRRAMGFQDKNPDALCPSCGKRKRHVSASGKVRSYCLPCRRERSKAARRRQNQRLLERIAAGEVLLCYRCKEQPREIVGEWVGDYCGDCRRDYMNAYNKRRRGK